MCFQNNNNVGKYIAERFLLSAFWGHNRDKNGEK